MRTTIKLTWNADITMEEYSDALTDIAQAIGRGKPSITNVRWNSEPIPATPVRKIRKPKKAIYEPPAEHGGEPVEE